MDGADVGMDVDENELSKWKEIRRETTDERDWPMSLSSHSHAAPDSNRPGGH